MEGINNFDIVGGVAPRLVQLAQHSHSDGAICDVRDQA
jgi:hypothetical protein